MPIANARRDMKIEANGEITNKFRIESGDNFNINYCELGQCQ